MTENIGGEVFVRIIPLPRRVGAVVLPNDDGTYDVYISSHLDQKQREQKLAHELGHVAGEHFYRELDVTLAEAEACSGSALPKRARKKYGKEP
jgi:hypothetical protein